MKSCLSSLLGGVDQLCCKGDLSYARHFYAMRLNSRFDSERPLNPKREAGIRAVHSPLNAIRRRSTLYHPVPPIQSLPSAT